MSKQASLKSRAGSGRTRQAGDGVDANPVLDDRVHLLTRRLEDGYQRIEEAAFAGNDVTEWESFWIKLLREYEQVCAELDRAA